MLAVPVPAEPVTGGAAVLVGAALVAPLPPTVPLAALSGVPTGAVPLALPSGPPLADPPRGAAMRAVGSPSGRGSVASVVRAASVQD